MKSSACTVLQFCGDQDMVTDTPYWLGTAVSWQVCDWTLRADHHRIECHCIRGLHDYTTVGTTWRAAQVQLAHHCNQGNYVCASSATIS